MIVLFTDQIAELAMEGIEGNADRGFVLGPLGSLQEENLVPVGKLGVESLPLLRGQHRDWAGLRFDTILQLLSRAKSESLRPEEEGQDADRGSRLPQLLECGGQ